VFEDEVATTVGNSESVVLPQVLTQPVIELSEVQKLTRDDYIGTGDVDAKLKALRAASQEADEKWVTVLHRRATSRRQRHCHP
jgi:hypothetical protein